MKTVLALALACGGSAAFADGPKSLEGKPIPAFSMSLVKGGSLSDKSLRGKVVVLDFWATWCAPCVAASPTMQKLYEKYKNKGLIVIGSNITDTPEATSAYAEKHHYAYPFSLHNEATAKKFDITAIPVFIFIDRTGVVRRVDTGFAGSSPASWEATVQRLLKS